MKKQEIKKKIKKIILKLRKTINEIYNINTESKKKMIKTKIIRCYNFISTIKNKNLNKNKSSLTPLFLYKMKIKDFNDFIDKINMIQIVDKK